jgi:hypothetical protein
VQLAREKLVKVYGTVAYECHVRLACAQAGGVSTAADGAAGEGRVGTQIPAKTLSIRLMLSQAKRL